MKRSQAEIKDSLQAQDSDTAYRIPKEYLRTTNVFVTYHALHSIIGRFFANPLKRCVLRILHVCRTAFILTSIQPACRKRLMPPVSEAPASSRVTMFTQTPLAREPLKFVRHNTFFLPGEAKPFSLGDFVIYKRLSRASDNKERVGRLDHIEYTRGDVQNTANAWPRCFVFIKFFRGKGLRETSLRRGEIIETLQTHKVSICDQCVRE